MDDHDVTRRAEHLVDQASEVYSRHGRIFRVVWIAVAIIIVLAGIAMIVLPGPVTIVVPFGLAMLAVVFGWARTALLKTVEAGAVAADFVERTSTAAKVLLGLAVLAGVAAVAAFLLTR